MKCLSWFLATIRLRRLLMAVFILFLNMLQPMYMYELPKGTIEEGFKCPIYDYNTWNGHVFQMKCGNGLVFHCAKEYDSKQFIKACAEEKHCLLGEEPLLRYTVFNQFEVLCRKCFDVNRFYNPSDDTLSSTISQCPEQKLNCDYIGVRECPIDDPQEIYYTDRKCMCDARNNYVPDCFPHYCGKISKFYCTSSKWEATSCFLHDSCPKGEERLIKNFTCVKFCDEGNFRPKYSDECIPDPHYTASTPTSPSVLSASNYGLTSASTSSTSSPTTIQSISPSSFNISTSSSRSVSTTDTGATTDYGKMYRWVYYVVVGVGVVAALIVGCCIRYFIKTKLIPAWKSTFIAVGGVILSSDDEIDSEHSVSGIEMSSMTGEHNTESVNPITDIQNISDDLKKEMVKTVLTKCKLDIINLLIPKHILDILFQHDWIDRTSQRDITEAKNTTEKNELIFNHVYDTHSFHCYDVFKSALHKQKQTELLRRLQKAERIFLHENGITARERDNNQDAAHDDTGFTARESDNNQDAVHDDTGITARESDNKQYAVHGDAAEPLLLNKIAS